MNTFICQINGSAIQVKLLLQFNFLSFSISLVSFPEMIL
jgi:hypothetical protein